MIPYKYVLHCMFQYQVLCNRWSIHGYVYAPHDVTVVDQKYATSIMADTFTVTVVRVVLMIFISYCLEAWVEFTLVWLES